MNRAVTIAAVIVVAAIATYNLACFQIGEWQQGVVLQFGKPVKTVTEAGLNFKTPFVPQFQYFALVTEMSVHV